MKAKYQVLVGDKWVTCTKATVEPSGWLSYQLRDGTAGVKRPGTWRKVEPQERSRE